MLIPAPTVLIVSDRPGAGHQPSLVQALVVSCLDYEVTTSSLLFSP